MIPQNNNIALLIHSCDRYELLYKGFEYFFLKYWNFNIDCTCYFATEEKEVTIRGFKNIRSGKGEWADRLSFLLKEKVKEEYVIYLQEDMWLNKKINAGFFNELFTLAKENNWDQIKLHSSTVYKTHPTDLYIHGFNISKIDNKNSDFLMSHQVTLWKKEFLLAQLHKREHPWRNERKGTTRLKKINPEIYQIDYFAENGNREINKNYNPVLRSEYYTISINGILSDNVQPFIRKMMLDKKLSDYAAQLQYNYKHKLTHDGNPKPRKIDIFKRTKKWITGK